MSVIDRDGRWFVDVPREKVAVGRLPNGPVDPRRIWVRRFIGVKVGDNHDGTIRIQIAGPAPNDFNQSVFHR